MTAILIFLLCLLLLIGATGFISGAPLLVSVIIAVMGFGAFVACVVTLMRWP